MIKRINSLFKRELREIKTTQQRHGQNFINASLHTPLAANTVGRKRTAKAQGQN